MRALTLLALVLAIAALVLAVLANNAALAEHGYASSAALAAEKARADDLAQRLDKLQVQLDAQAKAPAPSATAAAKTPQAIAVGSDGTGSTVSVQLTPAPAAVDDAHIKEVVDAELQAQFQRMRAQWGGGQGGGAWGQPSLADAASVKSQLGVTDDQKADQTAKIIADMRSAVRDVWRGGGDRDTNMKKMQDLRADAETKLADVLTPEQLAKAKQLLDQQGGGRGRGRGGPGGPGGGDANAAQPAPAAGGQQPAAEQPKGTSF